MNSVVIANGKQVAAKLPCTLEEFLVAQGLLPRSVVLAHAVLAHALAHAPRWR